MQSTWVGQVARKDSGMMTVEDILTATGGRVISSNSHAFTGIAIDSRTIREGELFVALKGSRSDGHNFVGAALEKGNGALVSLEQIAPVKNKTIIFVHDTLKALQDIARHMRSKRDIPVVAVTGSNGKTTTKELIASILGTQYRVLKNTGNLNNHIGLPVSLTRISDADEVVVLEMGASNSGEIKALCDIADPDYGVLTNISPAHLEGFGDIETVRKTKLELLDYAGVAVVNADDAFMMEGIRESGFQGLIVRYGISNSADVSASNISLHEKGSVFLLHLGADEVFEVSPKVSGMFNIYNLLAAASVGKLFAVDPGNIKKAIDSFTGVPMRLEFKDLDGMKIISDVYNANPASMEEAVKELGRIKRGRAIAVLGDMLELGPYGDDAHRRIGRLLSSLKTDIFIAVGTLMGAAASEFQGDVYTLKTSEEAGRLLKKLWQRGDSILIKGSRGMHMEKVLEE
jgi:UDP-N-acetylmuramoyl-tripeptide--D-alanyl-D-alanine ligase